MRPFPAQMGVDTKLLTNGIVVEKHDGPRLLFFLIRLEFRSFHFENSIEI